MNVHSETKAFVHFATQGMRFTPAFAGLYRIRLVCSVAYKPNHNGRGLQTSVPYIKHLHYPKKHVEPVSSKLIILVHRAPNSCKPTPNWYYSIAYLMRLDRTGSYPLTDTKLI